MDETLIRWWSRSTMVCQRQNDSKAHDIVLFADTCLIFSPEFLGYILMSTNVQVLASEIQPCEARKCHFSTYNIFHRFWNQPVIFKAVVSAPLWAYSDRRFVSVRLYKTPLPAAASNRYVGDVSGARPKVHKSKLLHLWTTDRTVN